MKAFISLPMKDRTRAEIVNDFNSIKDFLEKEMGMEVVNSLLPEDLEIPEGANKSIYCLGKSIEAMSQCDVVFMANGWNAARGCTIEKEVAYRYGLSILKAFGPRFAGDIPCVPYQRGLENCR